MPVELQRFRDAQDGVIDTALAELRRGRKQSHWMWFVFPQLAGLGRSGMAERYAIRSSMTLFALVSPPGSVFHRAIDRFYEGEMDNRTLDLLGRR